MTDTISNRFVEAIAVGILKEEARTKKTVNVAVTVQRFFHWLSNCIQSAHLNLGENLKVSLSEARLCRFRIKSSLGNPPMNVLMVSRGVFSLPPRSSGGGAERHAYELASALAHHGHNVHLVTPSTQEQPMPQALQLCRTEFDGTFIHPNVPFYGWLIKHGLASAATFRRTIHELRDASAHYDVLHVHGNLNAYLLSRLTKQVPIVYSVHDPPPSTVRYDRMDEKFVREAVFRRIDIPAMRRVDHVISVNPAIKQNLIGCGIEPKKISVIPSGTHLTSYMSKSRDKILGIFVGQLVHRKGAHLLVQALSRVPGVQLLIVGDGPEKTRLLELSRRLRCSDRVTFCGYLPKSTLDEHYERASFGVFPTLADAMPTLALLECMARGVLPIVSRLPGADWVITSNENGFLFAPGSIDELVNLLSTVSSNPEQLDRIGKRARQTVDQRFTWDRVAHDVESVYQGAIEHQHV
jgi:glycosyltransferase involved in cell wall biosynthesis